MNELARRYAQALYQVSPDEHALRITAQGLLETTAVWESLCSPAVQAEEKQRLLARLPGLSSHATLLRFYQLLARKGRMPILPLVLEAFHEKVLQKENAARCVMTCVHVPDQMEQEQICALLCRLHQKTAVHLEIRTDPSLLGGFTLELEGVTYDKSVRGALAGLARQLEERRTA